MQSAGPSAPWSQFNTPNPSQPQSRQSSQPPSRMASPQVPRSGGPHRRTRMSTGGSSSSGGGGQPSGGGSGSGSGSGGDRRRGGCFSSCFGYAQEVDLEQDDDGLYYRLSTYTGGPFNDRRGTLFMRQVQQLLTSAVMNSFQDMDDPQRVRELEYVLQTLHERFPNPENQRVGRDWLRSYATTYLNNKRARIRRQARANNGRDRAPPRGVHMGEWQHALREVREGIEFPQQAAAHQSQLDQGLQPHWGSTSKAAWKDNFVSN